MILLSSETDYKDILDPDNREFEIALTSGCFDLVHSGHVYFLQEMKEKTENAKQLIVLHDDKSVREHKGTNRPVMPEKERAVVLDALKTVDYVIVWQGWENIIDLVMELKPQYLVTSKSKIQKGGWEDSWENVADKVGAKLIGVEEIDHESSTTELINRIKLSNE